MLEAIRKRRSIRKYLDITVTGHQLETLFRSAMQAPSARNTRPWEFISVTDRELLSRIPEYHPYSSMVPSAGAAILVCGNKRKQPVTGYLAEDCSAAVQNILLEAVNIGLGAVWLGVYPREERMAGMSELFGLPEHLVPMALISLGVPGEEKPFDDRYDPDLIHENRWA